MPVSVVTPDELATVIERLVVLESRVSALEVVEQQADYIVPMSGSNSTGGHPFVGAPVAGLTNTQCLAQHGVCVNGEICPANHETIPGVTGLIVRGS